MLKRLAFVVVAVAVWSASALAQTAPAPESGTDKPAGFVGPSLGHPSPIDSSPDFVPIPDRWRLGLPHWNRYERPIEAPYVPGRWWDPYNQNVIKGDYPILGQNIFMSLAAISDTLFEARRIPTPCNVSSAEPDCPDVFGNGDQILGNQNFILSFELFKGDTAFKPRDWELRLTGVFNFNYLKTNEQGVVNADVREGTDRFEDHATLQEFFVEYHLGDISPTYDFVSSRAGIQGFVSDFRGFIFTDNALGFRLFGDLGSNRHQFNAAYFRPFEKDTNSGLNRIFDTRGQHVGIVNYFHQDFLTLGYTTSFSAHYLHDAGGEHIDENGFVVRPAIVGTPEVHVIDAVYLGWTGDGHLGRLNVNHAFYQVVGRDSRNPISASSAKINAQMAAAELSVDLDWVRPKFTFFWASGDDKPLDRRARGFDSIIDNPNFAGGGFSYWVRQGIPLATTSVELTGRNSLLPALRSSKIEGQPNYINPGLFLFGVGADFELTPKLRLSLQANKVRFHKTETLEVLLFQDRVRNDVGWDLSMGVRWRPLLIDNVIVNVGGATFIGGDGFKDIYQSKEFRFGPQGLEKVESTANTILYSGFVSLTLTY
ncbi:MAG TPA: hypothetical protein VGD07_14050 [Methylomirabilota bacterium]